MKLFLPEFEIESPTEAEAKRVLKRLERIARTCYQSKDKITKDSAYPFLKRQIIEPKHEAMLEHGGMTVRLVTSLQVTHELVRHRMASYAQESSRFCRYKDGIGVIPPLKVTESTNETDSPLWIAAMQDAEKAYLEALASGWKAQDAASLLPKSTKTEIWVTANFRQWRLMFTQRTSKRALPEMRRIMIPLLSAAKERIPLLFDDIIVEES